MNTTKPRMGRAHANGKLTFCTVASVPSAISTKATVIPQCPMSVIGMIELPLPHPHLFLQLGTNPFASRAAATNATSTTDDMKDVETIENDICLPMVAPNARAQRLDARRTVRCGAVLGDRFMGLDASSVGSSRRNRERSPLRLARRPSRTPGPRRHERRTRGGSTRRIDFPTYASQSSGGIGRSGL